MWIFTFRRALARAGDPWNRPTTFNSIRYVCYTFYATPHCTMTTSLQICMSVRVCVGWGKCFGALDLGRRWGCGCDWGWRAVYVGFYYYFIFIFIIIILVFLFYDDSGGGGVTKFLWILIGRAVGCVGCHSKLAAVSGSPGVGVSVPFRLAAPVYKSDRLN